ncbi:addiction module antidote protein, HigA family [Lutibacter sp. HS1-25]|uniref:HigA family addiction module antitoxin n=1 Tax=Lutibacter sp. HS1-25 TaxID=2485000 RepID=UPI001012FCCC|nr:HigA family addiction module antitoxin [Lutibacter sp. HS1-25]RXP52914.1 addiction module antidote protein, HigA family [Lutibacter sp. HS1-25]
MLPQLFKIKGLHPGVILKRELSRQDMKSSELADAINEHKQTISAILNQRRGINPSISIKLAKHFNVEEDYFMLLQASYDVKIAANNLPKKQPNLDKFRKIIFWDTTMDKIDWVKNKKAIIKRILERGNETEINEIISFYGKDAVSIEIKSIKKSYLSTFKNNAIEYNLI